MLELYGLFVDAVEKVEINYVRPVSRRELLESALEEMLQNLDPQFIFHQHQRVEDVPEAARSKGSSAAESVFRLKSTLRTAGCG